MPEETLFQLASAIGNCMQPHAQRLQESASIFLFGHVVYAREPGIKADTDSCSNFSGWGSDEPDQSGRGLLLEIRTGDNDRQNDRTDDDIKQRNDRPGALPLPPLLSPSSSASSPGGRFRREFLPCCPCVLRYVMVHG